MLGRIVEDFFHLLAGIMHDRKRDDDGDGIPNCLDDDYVPPEDGDGNQWKGGGE